MEPTVQRLLSSPAVKGIFHSHLCAKILETGACFGLAPCYCFMSRCPLPAPTSIQRNSQPESLPSDRIVPVLASHSALMALSLCLFQSPANCSRAGSIITKAWYFCFRNTLLKFEIWGKNGNWCFCQPDTGEESCQTSIFLAESIPLTW